MKTLNTKNSNTSIIFFILKIWGLTSLISSFIFILINYFLGGINGHGRFLDELYWYIYVYMITLIISFYYSLSTMLILGLVIKFLTNKKLLLVFISILLVFVTFYLIGFKHYFKEAHIIRPTYIYSFVISILIWIIPLRTKTK